MLPKTMASPPPYACEPLTNQGGRDQRGQGGQSGPSLRPLRLFSPWAGGASHDSRRPSPMPYYALPVPTPSPPRDYPCRRTLAHTSQAVHMPCLLIFMHGGSQVRGSRQSIFNSELEDSLFKDYFQVPCSMLLLD